MLAKLVREPGKSKWADLGRIIKLAGYAVEPDTAESVFDQRVEPVWERGFALFNRYRPTYLAGLQAPGWRETKWSEMAILARFRSLKLRNFEQCCVLLQLFEYPYSVTILVRESS